MSQITAVAHPNIAFIKYWGNRDDGLRLPVNGSISMNLDGLETNTLVEFDSGLKQDQILINGQMPETGQIERVVKFLDLVRSMAGSTKFAFMSSKNNFPSGAGIASSASAFAALALAATTAAGLVLDTDSLSRLARRGSGSACRSIPSGFSEWLNGDADEKSFAISIAPPDHWKLVDCIAVVSNKHKIAGSTLGHSLAATSLVQAARITDSPRRLDICRSAILQRDFSSLAAISEADSDLLHAVMMTSNPPLFYWQPATLALMQAVREARAGGLPVFYTIDAGPNVHLICQNEHIQETMQLAQSIPGVQEVLIAGVGGPARLVS